MRLRSWPGCVPRGMRSTYPFYRGPSPRRCRYRLRIYPTINTKHEYRSPILTPAQRGLHGSPFATSAVESPFAGVGFSGELATEAIAECIRSGGVWEAESNIDLLDLVSTPAAADWDASFTVKRINL